MDTRKQLIARIERRYGGADSDWLDFFPVARKTPRAA